MIDRAKKNKRIFLKQSEEYAFVLWVTSILSPISTVLIYDTFCFVTLCSYFHDLKRIDGLSIRKFVHERSPLNFKDSDSFNHRAIALENSEITRFRKARNRHLSKNEVYIKDTNWGAISKDAAYEWEGVFAIESAEENVKEVCKRIKNLYSGPDEVFDLEDDDRYSVSVRR